MMWRGEPVGEPDDGNRGIALILALMTMTLLTVLALALTLVTMTETRVSANFSDGVQTLHAADAAIEITLGDLKTIGNWNSVLTGAATSSFVDGVAAGARQLSDRTTLDLTQQTNLVRCAKTSACTDAEMDAVTDNRPWGPNNPRWQLFAYGPLDHLFPGNIVDSPMYVIVWAGDDSSENDSMPLQDGALNGNPGRGIIELLAHAYGPGGIRRRVEVTVMQTQANGQAGARILSWRELR